MTRHERTPLEVAERARLIGEIVLDTDLPSANLLDTTALEAWGATASRDPYREGALRFDFDGHDILFRYRPASDRLSISTSDGATPTRGTLDNPGTNLRQSDAERRSRRCLEQLEEKGVIGHGEFEPEHSYASIRPTYVEADQSAWIDRYNFVYHPSLDGLPLTSAEVIIGVNANTGRCQRITVSGQVTLVRLRDARVDVQDESEAQRLVNAKVRASAPVELRAVHVDGHFGYYLPLTSSSGEVSPSFIAGYSTETGSEDPPLLSRRKLVALPLANSEEATLVDLLGPGW